MAFAGARNLDNLTLAVTSRDHRPGQGHDHEALPDDLGAGRSTTSTALLAYGLAGVAATVLLGRASAWSAYRRLLVVCAMLLAALTVLATLPLGGRGSWVVVTAVVATAVLGAAAISLSLPLQELVFLHAGPAPDAASSLFVGAFNLGISGGALLGGLLLATSGSGLLPLAAVVIAGAGVLYARRSPIVSRPRLTRSGTAA